MAYANSWKSTPIAQDHYVLASRRAADKSDFSRFAANIIIIIIIFRLFRLRRPTVVPRNDFALLTAEPSPSIPKRPGSERNFEKT